MTWQDFLAAGCIVGWIVGMIPALHVAGRYDMAHRWGDPIWVFNAVFLWPLVLVGLVVWWLVGFAFRAFKRVYLAGVRAGRS